MYRVDWAPSRGSTPPVRQRILLTAPSRKSTNHSRDVLLARSAEGIEPQYKPDHQKASSANRDPNQGREHDKDTFSRSPGPPHPHPDDQVRATASGVTMHLSRILRHRLTATFPHVYTALPVCHDHYVYSWWASDVSRELTRYLLISLEITEEFRRPDH